MPRDDTASTMVFSPEFTSDPYPIYSRLREQGPVHQVVTHRGVRMWLVTRYDDVRPLLTDLRLGKDGGKIRELFGRHAVGSSAKALAGFPEALTVNMVNSDPPDHTRLRTLVSKVFTARRVAGLRPRIEEITDELLSRMGSTGEVDLVDALAIPLPISVVSEMLGVPPADRADFFRWGDVLTGFDKKPEELADAATSLVDYLTALSAAKHAQPADDLLSALVQVRAGGDRLSETELVSTAMLLLVAGHETTSRMISNGVLALLRHPDQLAALRADPALLPTAVEELLRYDGPSNIASMRFTTEPVKVGDVVIPEGEFVLLSLGAANRDPKRFADAERLDITRDSGGHLTFGHGIHYCVAAALGRLEVEISIGRLLARFPELSLAVDPADLDWQVSTFFRGPRELPVRLGALALR